MKLNIRSNIKKVILTIVILLAAVLVVCGACMADKFTAWADSAINDNTAPLSTATDDTETVKRAVYSTKKNLPCGQASSLNKYLNDYKNRFSHFEYVIGLPVGEYANGSKGYTGFGYIHSYCTDEYCEEYSLGFHCRNGVGFDGADYDGSFYGLMYGMYMNEKTEIFNNYMATASDGLYLTLTDESLYFSYYSGWSGYTNDEYRDSLSNILTVFYKGSSEYDLFYEHVLSSDGWFNFFSSFDSELNTGFESITLFNFEEVPKKEGYTFTGWYYDEACTQKYDGGFVDSNVKLYAGYEINKYTVTYYSGLANDPNEAGLYDRIDKVEHGSIADYVPPTVEGATFEGWYYEDGTKYENTPITKDTTFYGHWENETYTVTLDFKGGTSEEESVYTVERGVIFLCPIVVREGYTFVGWRYVDENGYLTYFYDTAIHSDLNLEAVWKRNVYTVELFVDDNLYETLEFYYGDTFRWNSDTTIKEGQTLIGWYLGNHCNNESEDCIEFDYMPIRDNLTLHGHFEVSKYTVNFYLDDEIVKTEIVEYGTELSTLIAWANDMDLRVLSLQMVDGGILSSEFVSCDINVETEKMNGFDKFLNGLKKNKWKVIGGVAGGIALIAVAVAVCNGAKRKRKR